MGASDLNLDSIHVLSELNYRASKIGAENDTLRRSQFLYHNKPTKPKSALYTNLQARSLWKRN